MAVGVHAMNLDYSSLQSITLPQLENNLPATNDKIAMFAKLMLHGERSIHTLSRSREIKNMAHTTELNLMAILANSQISV